MQQIANPKLPRLRRQASVGAQCRICFEGPEEGVLFKPCHCDGSQKYIHVKCLDLWRKNGGRAASECPSCRYKYKFSQVNKVEWMSHWSFVVLLSTAISAGIYALFWMLSYTIICPAMDGHFLDLDVLTSDVSENVADATICALILFALLGWLSSIAGHNDNDGGAGSLGRCMCDCFKNSRHNPCEKGTFVILGAVLVLFGIYNALRSVYETVAKNVRKGRDRIQSYVLDQRDG